MFHLNDEHAPRIESFVFRMTTIQVVHLETSHYSEGVFLLVRADLEHSGRDSECFERLIVQPFVEVYQLRDKSHVRVHATTTLLAIVETVLESHAPRKYQVADAQCRRSRDPLHTVHEDAAVLLASIFHEFDGLVEHGRNLLSNVIFQVVSFVDHSIIFEIVLRIVTSAVDHMRDAIFFEEGLILSHLITSQIQESIDNLRAHTPINQVFILFSRGAFEVEILVV
jgi:hypothetical protein